MLIANQCKSIYCYTVPNQHFLINYGKHFDWLVHTQEIWSMPSIKVLVYVVPYVFDLYLFCL